MAVYAVAMSANNRQSRSDTDFTDHVDHYSLQAAMVLAVLSLAVLASCWLKGRRQIGTYVGVTAAYLGALSFRWADYPGAVSTAWALAMICWGLGIAGWAGGAHTPGETTVLPAAVCGHSVALELKLNTASKRRLNLRHP